MLDSENCARDSYGDVMNAGADLAFSSVFSSCIPQDVE